jgi:hypothetical protein
MGQAVAALACTYCAFSLLQPHYLKFKFFDPVLVILVLVLQLGKGAASAFLDVLLSGQPPDQRALRGCASDDVLHVTGGEQSCAAWWWGHHRNDGIDLLLHWLAHVDHHCTSDAANATPMAMAKA